MMDTEGRLAPGPGQRRLLWGPRGSVSPLLGRFQGWSLSLYVEEPCYSRVRISASLVAQQVKNPPAMQETQETWVRSLGQEDPQGEEMATHSSILAWKIPWTEEHGGLQPERSHKSPARLSN